MRRVGTEKLRGEICGLHNDLSGAFGCRHACSRAVGRRSKSGPRIGATSLFRMSRDREGAGQLAKPKGADIRAACSLSWNDERRPFRGAYHAARGNAHVQVFDERKRRYYRLHSQPALADGRTGRGSPLPKARRRPRGRRGRLRRVLASKGVFTSRCSRRPPIRCCRSSGLRRRRPRTARQRRFRQARRGAPSACRRSRRHTCPDWSSQRP